MSLIDVYQMVSIIYVKLLYINWIHWRTDMTHYARIVLNRKLNLAQLLIFISSIFCSIFVFTQMQYVCSNQTLINCSCQTWPTLNQVDALSDKRFTQSIASQTLCIASVTSRRSGSNVLDLQSLLNLYTLRWAEPWIGSDIWEFGAAR